MALVFIKGHAYYTKSFRRAGRVTSRSVGGGELAVLMARMDRVDREEAEALRAERSRARATAKAEAQARRDALKALRDRLAAVDHAVAGRYRRLGRAAEATLEALGYHKADRSRWRRRRTMGSELAKSVAVRLAMGGARELARLVREADRSELERLACAAHRDLYDLAEGGDLAEVALWMLAQTLGDGWGESEKEAIRARVATLKLELAPGGASIPEQLLAERAAVCWLEVQLLAMSRADALNRTDVDYRGAEGLDRWLSRAQARFERALTSLAKVRRLGIPVVVNQLNVGGQVTGAVQVNGE
jgi:hypothetical protein